MARLDPVLAWRPALLAAAAVVLTGGAAKAAVCVRPGYPVGCTVGAGPVVNPTPGVGYGAPGAGLRPAAGPGHHVFWIKAATPVARAGHGHGPGGLRLAAVRMPV